MCETTEHACIFCLVQALSTQIYIHWHPSMYSERVSRRSDIYTYSILLYTESVHETKNTRVFSGYHFLTYTLVSFHVHVGGSLFTYT